jgi:protein SCO1/2
MRILALLVATAALAVGCASAQADGAKKSPFLGLETPPGTAAADFALRDQNGRLVRLSAQRGHFVFLTFLYTHCQDICPLVAEWLDEAARGQNARVLAVSVDPAGDTPAAVRQFVRTHGLGPEFHWLLGTRDQLAPVWQSYDILVETRSLVKVSHAAPVFLIDRGGKPRLFYPPVQNAREFRHDLRLLERE